jgi:hypothetical protein
MKNTDEAEAISQGTSTPIGLPTSIASLGGDTQPPTPSVSTTQSGNINEVIQATTTHKRNAKKTTQNTPTERKTTESTVPKQQKQPKKKQQEQPIEMPDVLGAKPTQPFKATELILTAPLTSIDLSRLTNIGKKGGGQGIADPEYAKTIASAFCGKSIEQLEEALSKTGTVFTERTKSAKTSGRGVQIEVKLGENQVFKEGDITEIEFHTGGGTAHSYSKRDNNFAGNDKIVYKKKDGEGGEYTESDKDLFKLDKKGNPIPVADEETGRYYRLHIQGKTPKEVITIKIVDKRYRNSSDEYAKIIWVEGLGTQMPMTAIPKEENVPREYVKEKKI